MLEAKRWLGWKRGTGAEGKKPRKVPFYANGTARSGKLDTPEDWARFVTFEDARAVLVRGGFEGLGFALGPDGSGQVWQGLDFDGVREHRELHKVLRSAPGYVEASPSQNGLHVIGYGRAFAALGSNASGIEAYAGGRFFTVTGRTASWASSEILDLSDFVNGTLRPLHAVGRAGLPAVQGGGAEAVQGVGAGVGQGGVATVVVVSPEVLDDLRSALRHLDADGYKEWTDVGIALMTLGEPGRELWHDWASTSGQYDPDEAETKWATFAPDRTSYKAIFAKAQRQGWRNPGGRESNDGAVAGLSDDALALEFAQENEASLRYCEGWGKWLKWDGVRWAEDKDLTALDWVRDLCRRFAQASGGRAAQALGSARTAAAVERLAKTDRRLAATTGQWDPDPWLLNTPGGVVDLKTGKLSPCSPALNMTKAASVAPEQGGAVPQVWLHFLDRITGGDEELRDYLQRVLGYALTGETSAHALFFGYGTGANGKSVLIDTVAGILGEYHKTAPMETFTESRSERHSTELAMLRGARLVTVAETEEGRRWAESRIKQLTGGDRISARFLYQDNFEFAPQFKLFIAGNHKPGLRSVDEAMRRRFHLIPFAVTIPPEERDEGLKDKLRAEWPGILAWMVRGCLDWQRGGLAPPLAVQEATNAYMEGQDALATWIEDLIDVDVQGWAASGDLFSAWEAWAKLHGEPVGTARRLTQALEARAFVRGKKGGVRGVSGLRLKTGDLPE